MSAWTCRHSDGKADPKIVPPRPRIPWWNGPGADSGEKREPASDVDSPKWWIAWKCLTQTGRLEKRTFGVGLPMSA